MKKSELMGLIPDDAEITRLDLEFKCTDGSKITLSKVVPVKDHSGLTAHLDGGIFPDHSFYEDQPTCSGL